MITSAVSPFRSFVLSLLWPQTTLSRRSNHLSLSLIINHRSLSALATSLLVRVEPVGHVGRVLLKPLRHLLLHGVAARKLHSFLHGEVRRSDRHFRALK